MQCNRNPIEFEFCWGVAVGENSEACMQETVFSHEHKSWVWPTRDERPLPSFSRNKAAWFEPDNEAAGQEWASRRQLWPLATRRPSLATMARNEQVWQLWPGNRQEWEWACWSSVYGKPHLEKVWQPESIKLNIHWFGPVWAHYLTQRINYAKY